MGTTEKAAFFDGIAEKWDGWEDLAALTVKLASRLEELGVGPHETIVDVGCGTGNLARAVLPRLSERGRIIAVDIAPGMLGVAQRKIQDARVEWHCTDAGCLPLADSSCDRVFCLSVWPHLENRKAVLEEFQRVLRPGGLIHVWHLAGRDRINTLHASTDGPVRDDLLPPAEEVAAMLVTVGFRVTASIDDADQYQVSAVRAV